MQKPFKYSQKGFEKQNLNFLTNFKYKNKRQLLREQKEIEIFYEETYGVQNLGEIPESLFFQIYYLHISVLKLLAVKIGYMLTFSSKRMNDFE